MTSLMNATQTRAEQAIIN